MHIVPEIPQNEKPNVEGSRIARADEGGKSKRKLDGQGKNANSVYMHFDCHCAPPALQ